MRKIIPRGIAFIAKTYLAAASPLAEDKIDQVRVMLADILRRDEESQKLSPAEESCKQLLRAIETG